jgi:PAB1-binding protein PBP1
MTTQESVTKDYKLDKDNFIVEEKLDENSKGKDWDQFDANKNKFKIESTYSEERYTTELNENEIPDEVKQNAEKIEKVKEN